MQLNLQNGHQQNTNVLFILQSNHWFCHNLVRQCSPCVCTVLIGESDEGDHLLLSTNYAHLKCVLRNAVVLFVSIGNFLK